MLPFDSVDFLLYFIASKILYRMTILVSSTVFSCINTSCHNSTSLAFLRWCWCKSIEADLFLRYHCRVCIWSIKAGRSSQLRHRIRNNPATTLLYVSRLVQNLRLLREVLGQLLPLSTSCPSTVLFKPNGHLGKLYSTSTINIVCVHDTQI